MLLLLFASNGGPAQLRVSVLEFTVFDIEEDIVPLNVGDTAVIRTTLTVDGTPTDPTTLQISVRDPSGTQTTYVYGTNTEVSRVSTGVYRADISCTSSGTWLYKWLSTGYAKGAADGYFDVAPPPF